MPDPKADAQSCQAFPDPLPGIIPFGSVCIMSGASGVGKTILKAEWVKRWIDGRSILHVPSRRPTHFYYLVADRPWRPTYAQAFANAGVSAKDMTVYALLDDPNYNPQRWALRDAPAMLFFRECLEKLQPIPGSALFVDPFAPLFIQGNQNDARSVAFSLHFIRKEVEKYQCTAMLDANVSKLKEGEDFKRAQDRISGSGAFLAYADTQFNFAADEHNTRTLHWQPRSAAPGSEQFVFDPKTRLFVLYDGLRDEGKTPQTDRPTRVLEQFPAEDPIRFAELYALVIERVDTIDRKTLHRDLNVLVIRGLIEHPAKDTYRRRKLA